MSREGGGTLSGNNSDKGVVLLLIMWVIVIMLSIILSFSFMTRTEALSTFSFTETIKRDFLAEAAISRAVLEIAYTEAYDDGNPFVEYEELWKADGTVYEGTLPAGKYKVMITSESGKINLNSDSAVRSLLKNLLLNKEIDENDVETIIDSILDWRDGDDLHRINGAETDYYKTLEPPYKAKNANFEVLDELLLVKGVTEELFYGSEETGRGLKDLVTVYSKTNNIDINTASEEVLRALPTLSDETVDEILERRVEKKVDGNAFGSENDNDNKIYTIEAVGMTDRGLSHYGIAAVVQLADDNTFKYKFWKNQSFIDIKEENSLKDK